jgi:hypothetical protein
MEPDQQKSAPPRPARLLRDLAPAEIRRAIAEIMPEMGHVEPHEIFHPAAAKLGSNSGAHPPGWEGRGDWGMFVDRVKRGLESLAKAGELVKIGANQVLPSGQNSYNTAHYYTLEAYEQAKTEGAGAQAAELARGERVKAVERRLTAAGFSRSLDFKISDWERLLDMAGLAGPGDREKGDL